MLVSAHNALFWKAPGSIPQVADRSLKYRQEQAADSTYRATLREGDNYLRVRVCRGGERAQHQATALRGTIPTGAARFGRRKPGSLSRPAAPSCLIGNIVLR